MTVSSVRFAELSSSRHYGVCRTITDVTYDSRKVSSNTLFVPVVGQRVDGYDYVGDAAARGACAVLTDMDHAPDLIKRYASSMAVIVSRSPVEALSRFSSLHILDNRHFTSVAVTGSCGKTTTKEMIASVLSVEHTVAATPGNLNSTLGLPLAVLSVDSDTDYAVFEMGVDHIGEMDMMTRILPPDLAVITNIGISHLEKFRSRENIAREKAKIILPQTEAHVPASCAFLDIIRQAGGRLTLVDNPFSDCRFLGLDGIGLTLGRHSFVMPAVGEHNIKDASLAVSVCRSLGCTDEVIAEGLCNLRPLFGRSRVVRDGAVTVIEDCYNASLDSVSDAIRTISRLSWNAGKLIVLGDMKELGSQSREAHGRVGQALCGAQCRNILLYGEEMEEAYRVLYDNGQAGRVFHTPSFEALSAELGRVTESGDLVLIKGSRSLAMERLHETLREVV